MLKCCCDHVSAAGYLIPFACMCGDEYCAAPELLEALDIDHMGVCSTQSPNKTGSANVNVTENSST